MYSRRYFINRKRESYYKKLLVKYNFEEINFDVDEINTFLKKNYNGETLINELDELPNMLFKDKFLSDFKDLNNTDILKRRFILFFKKIN